ncbi:hypothetical protein OROGR_010561 [Orobanche gracilis]
MVHPVVHVSLLKKAIGEVQVKSSLPDELLAVDPPYVPEMVLERRLVEEHSAVGLIEENSAFSGMKEIATENFQRVCEAYEILTDENKRMIYDIYGMEGLTSGLEIGPKLNKVDEIREELEKMRRQREQEKISTHIRPSGSILANLSWPDFLDGDGIMRGMAMASEVQSEMSKRTSLAVGGNLAVSSNSGGGAATAVLRHRISPVSFVELMGSIGLQSLIGLQTSRQLSVHSTAIMGITMSLRDGSINLSNTWSRQLSETTNGNIQLSLGPESSIGVGWRKKEQTMSASGEIKTLAPAHLGQLLIILIAFPLDHMDGLPAQLEDGALALEIGGGRKISKFSTVRMLYSIGIQGLIWKFELHRGGQKLVIPKGFAILNAAVILPANSIDIPPQIDAGDSTSINLLTRKLWR